MLRLTGPAMALLALAACTPMIDNHGHRFDADMAGAIVPGVTSKQEVARLMGSPSALATFEDDEWYYVAQKTERKSFYQAEITDQQVLAISFGDDGLVTDVTRSDLSQAKDITPVADITPTSGNELSLAQQLLGNIGRFNSEGGPTDRSPPFWSQRSRRPGS
ncbi:MAG TPA: outer membrane protein assembly factor BamE [Geminicoccus sp.]|uniref:outer membrane protein assembly factor BamE n=1 Tax=Geminicoccus sp. TaxID=2024832 RepID=UPI002C7F8D43|nr:outer membrane protein assembly factor BamE [Geminicoccus sp.]HWL71134.1 outer membrane protein assembly factor BamE [Geminicoccus sp.]